MKKKEVWLASDSGRCCTDIMALTSGPPQPHWHSHLESLPFAPQPPAQSQHGKEVRREEAFK